MPYFWPLKVVIQSTLPHILIIHFSLIAFTHLLVFRYRFGLGREPTFNQAGLNGHTCIYNNVANICIWICTDGGQQYMGYLSPLPTKFFAYNNSCRYGMKYHFCYCIWGVPVGVSVNACACSCLSVYVV